MLASSTSPSTDSGHSLAAVKSAPPVAAKRRWCSYEEYAATAATSSALHRCNHRSSIDGDRPASAAPADPSASMRLSTVPSGPLESIIVRGGGHRLSPALNCHFATGRIAISGPSTRTKWFVLWHVRSTTKSSWPLTCTNALRLLRASVGLVGRRRSERRYSGSCRSWVLQPLLTHRVGHGTNTAGDVIVILTEDTGAPVDGLNG
jgi:hypothetical protein